jgi:LPPG:FO 2-phospho-L-lactate transferase
MKIVAFAGGVGGAKLADGLSQCLPGEDLTIVVNTGDDFEHWGLNICPDLDTVCYTLAGLANPETGWGRSDETWQVFESVCLLQGSDWFRIGDKDLATHIERTRRLKAGQSLSQIVRDFCLNWKIGPTILPATDQPVATIVETVEQGDLAFQEYFVHQQCSPTSKGFRFAGIETAKPAPGVLQKINQADAIVFCPSNPWVSIDPILKIPGITPSLLDKKVIAVSPIIAGQTVKGPAAKMFSELGIKPTATSVAEHYGKILSGFVLDTQDINLANDFQNSGTIPLFVNTLMKTSVERHQLAIDVLNFIERLIK